MSTQQQRVQDEEAVNTWELPDFARGPQGDATNPVDTAKINAVYERLVVLYGLRQPHAGRGNPLDELIGTILSQNTSDVNSGRAYNRLRERFPSWYEVLHAPTEDVYEAIKPAGLGAIKAPRIQQTLAEILKRRGELSLDFLADLPMEQAKAWLRSLHGIGPKTTACVLLFALHMPALPVDTHVHRVSRRLGLIAPKVSAEAAHILLEAALPPEQVYTFHVDMIQHGRRICHSQRPRCDKCALLDLCDYGQEVESVGSRQSAVGSKM